MNLETSLLKFGFNAFRPGQREAIEILLDEGRLLLVAPTGGGKSLSYQLPASMFPGTTLVISPLGCVYSSYCCVDLGPTRSKAEIYPLFVAWLSYTLVLVLDQVD